MRVFIALILSCFAFAAMAEDVDRDDPAATAAAFLAAYQSRDLVAMAPLMNANNREFFDSLAAQGESHPRYRSIFKGWRWDAVTAWGGALGETRYKDGEAVVLFGEMSADEVAVVVLTREAEGWAVEDVNSPSPDDFTSLPTEP